MHGAARAAPEPVLCGLRHRGHRCFRGGGHPGDPSGRGSSTSAHTSTGAGVSACARGSTPRIFQRSFTTKSAPGQSRGTYSMRLLAEQYLGGSVSFTSKAQAGTTFTLALP